MHDDNQLTKIKMIMVLGHRGAMVISQSILTSSCWNVFLPLGKKICQALDTKIVNIKGPNGK